ncbi:MAG TPA: hypothetical protein ENK63_05280 [Rhodobacterales bacterium]|nr:hypothetical protein [Rhodobacterales bacterium]
MKLCVVGNSHIGMFRAGLGADISADVTFFALAQGKYGNTELRGSTLVETSAKRREILAGYGLADQIDLADFDGVVFTGSVGGVPAALALAAGMSVSSWPSGQKAMIEARKTAAPSTPLRRPLLSGAAFEAAFEAISRGRRTHRLASALRTNLDLPIFIVPEPLPSAHVTTQKQPLAMRVRQVQKHGDGRALLASLRTARQRAYADIPRLEIIEQPGHTIEQGFLTKPAFTRGAIRIDGVKTHGTEDFIHGNADLGALLLLQVASALEIASKTR